MNIPLLLHRLLLPVVLTAMLGGCTAARETERQGLRIVCYNIHHGEGTDGRFDLIRLAETIRAFDPDLVALQEVDHTTRRAGWRNQALEIASLLNMHQVYGPAMAYQEGQYGVAILSRWPIERAETVPLPKIHGSEPRALLITEIDTPAHGWLRFACTHLAHDSGEDRLEQAHIIHAALAERRLPTILAGDLNAEPDHAPILLLRERFQDAFADDPRPTFPNVDPNKRIDYILHDLPGWRLVEAIVHEHDPASDHCLIFARFEPLTASESAAPAARVE